MSKLINHTPGPWEVVNSEIHSADEVIAEVYILDGFRADEANARLIAAAPDLLEACLTVVNGYETDGMEGMGNRDEVFYKFCKAAIAKAKGQQPQEQS